MTTMALPSTLKVGLSRDALELRTFIREKEAKGGHLVETVRSGVYDLSTSNGRKRLRDDTSDAEHEVDHLHERVDDQKAEAARRRPYGPDDRDSRRHARRPAPEQARPSPHQAHLRRAFSPRAGVRTRGRAGGPAVGAGRGGAAYAGPRPGA
jgi:hypothetical protein